MYDSKNVTYVWVFNIKHQIVNRLFVLNAEKSGILKNFVKIYKWLKVKVIIKNNIIVKNVKKMEIMQQNSAGNLSSSLSTDHYFLYISFLNFFIYFLN